MDTGVPSKNYGTPFITGYLVNQINSWSKPNNHWAKRHILTRVVSAVAITSLAALDTLYNSTAATLKLPVTTFKITAGEISIPLIGKLGDLITYRAGPKNVLRDIVKTIVFAADMLIGPALGVINPRWTVQFHHKWGIIHEIPIIIQEDKFNNDPEMYHFPASPSEDPLDFNENDMERYIHSHHADDTTPSSPKPDITSLNSSIPWPQPTPDIEVPQPVSIKEIQKESAPNKLLSATLWFTNEWFYKPLESASKEQ